MFLPANIIALLTSPEKLDTSGKMLKPLSKSTLDDYDSNTRRLFAKCGLTEFDINKITKEMITTIKTHFPNNPRNIINGIIRIFRELNHELLQFAVDESNNIAQKKAQEKKQPEESKTFEKPAKSMEPLRKRREFYENTIISASQYRELINKLLVFAYTEISPLRGEAWRNCTFDKYKEYNYIDFENMEIVLPHHKTEKQHGEIRYKLTQKLINVIQEHRKLINSMFLIPNKDNRDEPINKQRFTDAMHSAIGENISCRDLRQLETAEFYDKGCTINQAKQHAAALGHSLQTELTVYTKHSELFNNNLIQNQKDEITNLKNTNLIIKDQLDTFKMVCNLQDKHIQLLEQRIKELENKLK